MKTRLTLSIDDQVVERARQIATEKGISLSKMVEEFLVSMCNQEEQKTSAVDRIIALMKGKIKGPLPDDYREFVRESRYQDELKAFKKRARS